MTNTTSKRVAQASMLRPREAWSAIDKAPSATRSSVEETRRCDLIKAIFRIEEDHGENLNRLFSALDRIRDTDPKDAVESMLAQQIEIVREYSLRAAHSANLAGDNLPLLERHLARLERLNTHAIKLIAALDKHRGRANQKVVVEHVNVAAGAQAIVGHVNAESPGREL